jgi:hypothetical protein
VLKGESTLNKATEIKSAKNFGQQAEDLVVAKGQCPAGDREGLLIGYWALIFDFHKGVLLLLENNFNGAAFALVRPVVEALVRAHVVLMGTERDIAAIRADEYRTKFGTVGSEIDKAFGLDGFFQRFLDGATKALHSYTHSGALQLGRRFNGYDLMQNYSDEEIVEVIRTTTSAIFMVTSLVTKHFNFEEEWKMSNQLFEEWGKSPV